MSKIFTATISFICMTMSSYSIANVYNSTKRNNKCNKEIRIKLLKSELIINYCVNLTVKD